MQQTLAGRVLARLGPWVYEVDRRSLRADVGAGLLGAVLALPQAIAYATLAGLPPAWGLYAAVLPCIVAALAGSSRLVATGPTNAVSIALAAMLLPLAARGSPEYLRLALVATLGVGLIQTAVALLRLGTLAHFISPSVLLGFTSGAALLIAWHAIESLAGDRAAVALACATLVVAWLLRHVWARGPFLLITLLLAAVAAWLGMRAGIVLEFVGELPQGGPSWGLPALAWSDLPRLAGISMALTVVALGQSIAIAKALALRTDEPLDVNRECLGQGLANLAGAASSSFVVSGSLNRSMPNLESGARTPLASVFSGLFVLALALLAAPAIAWIPMAAIAGLLLWVAATLIDREQWRERLQLDRAEAAIAAATLAATLALPLEQAILGGVGLSLVVYLYRTSRPALRTMGFDRPGPERAMVVVDEQPGAECPQLKMLRMEGSVWFGAVAHVGERLQALRAAPGAAKHLLVMAKSMNFIDHAGATLWEQEHARRLAMGGDLYFHRPRPEVMQTWQRRRFVERLGPEHVFDAKHSALASIVPRLDPAVCAGCRVRLYAECAAQPAPADQGLTSVPPR
ncbi:SulP family inorganic anion transporter [Rubrivivax gelatinosus]|uniref:Sulfate transporter n=1 Tax=Rubrivivax gelatinosus TaxID=28068 RepID=A0ABS1DWN9_RUBGE|nr:SulP family inorganic anion transporter [Rubrivivax gelatinosus]MBK1713600.1 sulfate transporter [Rubrivivax gelatinosus]